MPKVTSRKSLTANRRNAAKSTGPTTPEGKDRVSQNAIRHGFYSDRAVLTGGIVPEDQEEFDTLLEQFYADFQPANAFECACVERMTSACWRIRRAYQYETTYLTNVGLRNLTISSSHYLPGKNDSDRLVRYESMLDRQFFRAHQRLMASRLAMRKAAALLSDKSASPPEAANSAGAFDQATSEPPARNMAPGTRAPEPDPGDNGPFINENCQNKAM